MAQLDRATVCGTVGRRFESSWARSFSHNPLKLPYKVQLNSDMISTFFL